MIDVLWKVHHPTHHLRLNRAFHNDLLWWRISLPSWNGCSAAFSTMTNAFPLHIWNYTPMHACLASTPTSQETGFTDHSKNMTFLFLAQSHSKSRAIAVAVYTWSDVLAYHNILSHCDNLSVVNILSCDTSKCRHIITLLRFLFFICAYYNIMLRAITIHGVNNHWVDALSRLQMDKFLAFCPMGSRQPKPVMALPLVSFK